MSSRSPIAADAQLTQAPSVISTSMPGETVIMDAAADQYFSLDGIGPRVWELLEVPATLASIVATILEEYDADAPTCERDVAALLDDLLERGLVVVST